MSYYFTLLIKFLKFSIRYIYYVRKILFFHDKKNLIHLSDISQKDELIIFKFNLTITKLPFLPSEQCLLDQGLWGIMI